MKKIATSFVCFCLFSALTWGDESPKDFQKYWPTWRGPNATGTAPHGNPPIEWNENKNIRWKVNIPGKGSSSPIVWGEIVFVTTAIPVEQGATEEAQPPDRRQRRRRRGQPTQVHKFDILAINRHDGKIRWQRTADQQIPHEGTHAEASWASNSPITDGEHVYAYFGSRGLYCYDMQGNEKWKKDLGNMRTRNSFGEGSSPTLYGDTIVINWDHEGQSFIIALDKKTGEERWKIARDEVTSWSTPIVVNHGGLPQVIANATGHTRGYDLATGNVIWESVGMVANVIPSPVTADGIVYVTSGHRGSALQAIRLADAKGDITDSDAIVWEYDRDTPYVPSPLLYGNTLYFLKRNNPILSCFNAKTGQAYYGPQRLEGLAEIYASPVGASNRVYLADRDGNTLVIKHGATFEVLAKNVLDDGFDASPAIVDQEIYLRGRKYLYCISSN